MLKVFNPGSDSFEEGLVLFNQGHFDTAIHHFKQSTIENPNSAQGYLYLGRSYISMGRWKPAIQPLRTAFRLSPHEAKDEIINLLIDAAFAAALNDPRLGEGESSPDRFKESL
ncbi:MAG: CDC27 family protein [Candidatus Binatia bacterium]